jgi:hypothetical protein
MEVTRQQIESIMNQLFRRAEAARNVGGISRMEVEDNVKVVPPGWKYDHSIDYFLPPNIDLI